MENNDLKILNLKQEKEEKSYERLNGTGVKPLRTLSTVLIILGTLLVFIGAITMVDAINSYSEQMYYCILELSSGVSCFVLSPICRCIATMTEAAKIYIDKNT